MSVQGTLVRGWRLGSSTPWERWRAHRRITHHATMLSFAGFLHQNEEETNGFLALELIEVEATPRQRAAMASLHQASVMMSSRQHLSSTNN
jgi:hypothetical protein